MDIDYYHTYYDRKALCSISLQDLNEAVIEYKNIARSLDLLPVMSQALAIVECGGTFKLWPCCLCNYVLSSASDHARHFFETHIRGYDIVLPPELEIGDLHLGLMLPYKDEMPQNPNKADEEAIRRLIRNHAPLQDRTPYDVLNRTELLDKISAVLEVLLIDGVLADLHLRYVKEVTDSTRAIQVGTKDQIFLSGFDESIEGIHYLPAPKLSLILEICEMIRDSCRHQSSDFWEIGARVTVEFKQQPFCVDIHNWDIPYLDHPEALVNWLYVDDDGNHSLFWKKMVKQSENLLKILQYRLGTMFSLAHQKKKCNDTFESDYIVGGGMEAEEKSPTIEEAEAQAAKADDLFRKISKIDAKLMWNQHSTRDWVQQIGPASAYDYRNALVMLVKVCLKKRIEDKMSEEAFNG